MLNIIQADLFKIFKSWTIKILFGITTLCSTIMVLIAYSIPQGKIDSGMTGIGFMFSDVNMISILGAVTAGIFICSDFDNKTIHETIACGGSRSSIIAGKSIVFFCAIGFILLPYAIATGIALSTGSRFSMGSLGVGFLNLLALESGVSFQVSELFKLLIVMLTLGIVYAAQLSICVLLAIVFKKPVFVVAVYYVFQILCAQLTGLKDSSQVFNTIFSCTPYGGNYSFLTTDSSTGDIIKAITVSLIFIMAILSVTYSIFRKSEIK